MSRRMSGQFFRKKCDRRGLCAGYEDLSVFREQCCLSGTDCAASGTGTDFAFGSGKFTVLSPQSISSNDTIILLRSDWKTEAIISCLREMRSLPVRKRSVIWDWIFPAM